MTIVAKEVMGTLLSILTQTFSVQLNRVGGTYDAAVKLLLY